jgi:hypothetical protein
LKEPFHWDSFSDQPYQIKDREAKKQFKQITRFDRVKTVLISLLMFPISLFRMIFPFKNREIDLEEFFGVGINLDKGEEQFELLQELQIKSINVRFPIWEMDNIDKYIEFLDKLQDYQALLTILQDRENIEDNRLFKNNIETIFQKFSEVGVTEFQIGNAINRSKWGFFSINEYLRFYQVAYKVRNKLFPDLKLVGSGVIDFEYYNTIHTLYNFYNIKYDAISSLLYVDRRGEPEGKQTIIFNLQKKIELLWSILSLSPKSQKKIYITETNYPIKNSEPYTPTSQYETVSPEGYRIYMVRYFLIAIATGLVERVYWHQLISAGYGLIDNRDGERYPAFNSFKNMLRCLSQERYISHKFEANLHYVEFQNIEVYWCIEEKVELQFQSSKEYIDIDGTRLLKSNVEVGKEPIYLMK